ncbi:MAG TPA: 3-carboxy-cis,cis-muconate cycloisomerase [Stellaceae bacterium]|nr:3-carboxy-cis,cis-muconate cycloisomerase [Stellaceae bacterium]
MTVNPADSAIYGGLFGTDEMRALFADRRRLGFMLEAEVALARAQAACGVVPLKAAEQIAAAADAERLDLAAIALGTTKTGQPVTALVAALTKAAGAEAGRWVHWGATTQDIVDTALVLTLREALTLIERDLIGLIDALATQAARHRDTVMAGRTFLQQALPITFGYKCAVWLAPLLNHLARLDELRPRLLVAQMGGAVGTLAALGASGRAVAERFAADLDLHCPDAPWHTGRDAIAETGCLLGMLSGSLAKLANDIILMAQTEVGEVAEPAGGGRGGSSTMPHKRNPIGACHVVAAARGAQTLVPLLLGAMEQEHERAAGGWQSEALALPQILTLTAGALAQGRALAEGFSVDADQMRQNLEITGGLIMAERVAMVLATRLGKSEAHHLVEQACAEAVGSNRHLAEVLADDARLAGVFDRHALDQLVDPAGYLGEAGAVADRVVARARAALAAR